MTSLSWSVDEIWDLRGCERTYVVSVLLYFCVRVNCGIEIRGYDVERWTQVELIKQDTPGSH